MSILLAVDRLDLYYGDAQALSDVSLDVPEGTITAIVGANGAGKSSLIRTIAGIERPQAGRITWRGQPIQGRPSHEICNLGIGQVAEGRQIFPTMSVLENLEVGGHLPRARQAKQTSLTEVFGLFPRLAERRSQAAGTLSGGEQQMLAIGRCLMGRPELIMFDEPSLGLSPALVGEMFRIIGRLNREDGLTIVLVEQNTARALDVADKVCVMSSGVQVYQGTAVEARAAGSMFATFLGINEPV